MFPLPSNQTNANGPAPQNPNGGRGVPDVSGDADPDTGYNVLINGTDQVIGGTSAVAPLFAGLFARINEGLRAHNLPRVGFVNPALYRSTNAFMMSQPVTTAHFRQDLAGMRRAVSGVQTAIRCERTFRSQNRFHPSAYFPRSGSWK